MKVKNRFTKKRVIYGIIIIAVLVGGYFMFFNKKIVPETLTVHPADFLQQVSASGTVVAKQNLDLSFQEPGQVVSVPVKVGDSVYAGQLLAAQNAGELQAQYLQMQAGVDLQKAKLDQLLAGNSPEDIQTTQAAVNSAMQNVNNAYANALTSQNGAYTAITNAITTVTYMQNTYFTSNDQEGFTIIANKKMLEASAADVKNYVTATMSSDQGAIDNALAHVITDLRASYDSLATIRQQCDLDVYYSRVTLADKSSLDTQKTSLNTSLTTVTSAQSGIASYKAALSQTQDALNAKKSPPRPADIAVYQAQVQQAQASLQNVAAQLNKKRIYSPIDGVVTAAGAKVGRIFSSNDVAVSVISKNDFQIESYIPQINISLLKIGQAAKVILDSYGDTAFDAKVALIDPAETIKDGVSTYKVTLEFTDSADPRIKSGMTGNIVITTLQKSNVISVPQGIVEIVADKKMVKVKTGDSFIETAIQTGSVASNGNVEVVSGLKEGDVVIVK